MVAATLHGQDASNNHSLQSFGRLLNVPVCSLSLETPVADFNKMTDHDIMAIDVTATPDEASQKIAEINAHVGAKDIGITATTPGSPSAAMLDWTSQRLAARAPPLALPTLGYC